MGKRQHKPPARGQVRIIGGHLRGRRIPVADQANLRPTSDRTRETLFNWLGHLHGEKVLDLFAGSGALGLEACSRGAEEVVMIERSKPAASQLCALAREWQQPGVQIIHADATKWLHQTEATGFSVVFIDPPFDSNLLPETIALLAQADFLAPDARIYIERHANCADLSLPTGWHLLREGRSKHTQFALYHA